jgi:excisionase family DNA binding protein
MKDFTKTLKLNSHSIEKRKIVRPEADAIQNALFLNRIAPKKQRLSVKELADYLGVSQKTIYGWTYRGIIPFEKIGPRLIRFDVEKIEKWISEQKGSP